MVNNIGSCRDGAIRGLRQELENLKNRVGPTETVVKNLRFALANTKELEEFHTNGMAAFSPGIVAIKKY